MNNTDEDTQSSVNPIQQSEVTAKNGNKVQHQKMKWGMTLFLLLDIFLEKKAIGLRNILLSY